MQAISGDDWFEIPQLKKQAPSATPRPGGRSGAGGRIRPPRPKAAAQELRIPADTTALAGLRRLLLEANFNYEGIYQALGVPEGQAFEPAALPAYVRRLSEGDPLGVLTKLFIVGVKVRADEVRRILSDPIAGTLLQTGLVGRQGRLLQSRWRIQPFEGLFFVVDPPMLRNKPDDVMGVTPSGRLVGSLTPRSPVGSALDLGCGCGLQSLLAARHADRVVAVDINPRAVLFTRFNLRLNGIDNVEVRTGDLYEPVRGERFDLVVCNPPFVVSPRLTWLFRDSGRPVNGLMRRILCALPDHLQEAGIGVVGCNWAHTDRGDWWEPIQPWVSEAGCDVLLLHLKTTLARDYAASWNQWLLEKGVRKHGREMRRWVRWYEREGIERITSAAVITRRRTGGDTWIRGAVVSGPVQGPAGDQVRRIFAALDHLAGMADPKELLEDRFSFAAGTQLQLGYVGSNGSFVANSALLSSLPGIGAQVSVEGALGERIRAINAERPLGEFARSASTKPGDQPDFEQTFLALARRLYGLGMLERAVGGR